jgi:hypothetical protein
MKRYLNINCKSYDGFHGCEKFKVKYLMFFKTNMRCIECKGKQCKDAVRYKIPPVPPAPPPLPKKR